MLLKAAKCAMPNLIEHITRQGAPLTSACLIRAVCNVRHARKYFNIASLITIILQYRRSVKHVFSVSAFLIHNTLQTTSPFIDAAVNQVLRQCTPLQQDRLLQLINNVEVPAVVDFSPPLIE